MVGLVSETLTFLISHSWPRQAWRVLTKPNSLSARILKAKYFPSCEFLQAQLGGSPSQVWRSILEGRDTLAQGIIRHIGDGRTTNIWQQNWIPRAFNMHPITSRVPNPPRSVGDLILVNGTAQQLLRYSYLRTLKPSSRSLCVLNMLMTFGHGFTRRTESSLFALLMLVTTKLRRKAWLEGRPDTSNSDREQKSWTKIFL